MTSVLKILIHVVWLAGFVKTRQDHFDAVVNLGSSETDTVVKVCQYVTGIYHINYGVIEGFLALRKAVKAHLKKYRIFFTCVWYRQSAADTSLAIRASRSGWWKSGEAFTVLQTVMFKLLLEREENQDTEKKNRKIRIQWLWWWNFSRGWERKSTIGRFATGRFWPCIRRICILKIMPMVCFCSVPTHFSCWALAPTQFTILI